MTFSPIRLLGLLVLLAAVALAVACGGGDSATTTPATSGAAASATGSSHTSGPGGSGTLAPTATPLKPAICTPADKQVGLVSQVEFNGQDGIYTPGQTVEITLLIANCGDNNAVLHFATAQRYDFHIVDANGVVVWSSADGKSYEQVEGTETLPPATEITYKETWNQKDRNGSQVPEATYKVSTFSMGCAVAVRAGCNFGPVRDIIITPTLPSNLPPAR